MKPWFTKFTRAVLPLACGLLLAMPTAALQAQGVTTGSMSGTVKSDKGVVASARVVAVHQPSGTTYQAISRADGRFLIPAMRVGGPYTVTAVALGYERTVQSGLDVTLGSTTDVRFELKTVAITLTGVQVTATGGALSSRITGASTTIPKEAIAAFPTIGRTITDFTRLTPQSSGSSFAGQDNRLNNITLDGSFFNNSFGLGSQPGARTGVSPIPIDAIEQIQVNIAPFDVRQGGFTGAGVNAVTKSGGNEFKGSLYYTTRNQGLVGDSTAGAFFNKGKFKFTQPGGYVSGPIIKNKLFFFVDYETDELTQPATSFQANTGGQAITGNTTRVLQSDVATLSAFLKDKFNYETGPAQGFNLAVPSTRIIAKIDWNVNDRNKFSFRYSDLESKSDQPISNSNALGTLGARRDNLNSMSFQNSGYAIKENARSYIGELNSQIGSNMSNQIIAGYTTNDESRESKGTLFPLVDINNNGTNYLSFGFEPFTPNNVLKYNTWQFQDNFSIYTDKHDLTFGVTAQRYKSDNGFSPGLQSAYVYNSLADFYTDANGFLANPTRTTAPVTLGRFQVRYNNIPGIDAPIQPLRVNTYGAYAQDEWRATRNLKVTAGLRIDLPVFENTAFNNALANQLSFRDETGATVKYNTGKLPDANLLISPRVGFNWDVEGDRRTVIRGGTGIFSGTPPYVWISNQLGNTGVLTGFDQRDNTTTRPFNPNPDTYKPTTVTGAPAATYELNVTAPDYKFSQVWRSNIAIDRRLPWGFIATLEGLYGKETNGPYYINANLPAANSAFTGADKRPRWTAGNNRINSNVNAAYVISNTNTGHSYNLSGSLQKSFTNGFFAKSAYAYGVTKNSYDPGSTAATNWTANAQSGDPNNPGVQFSNFSPGHRVFLALSYRKEYFKFGATSISLFTEGRTQGNSSYTFSADANGDAAGANDLIYIPRNTAEMNFQQYGVNAAGGVVTTNPVRVFTVADQQAAWEAYITQDKYLSARRGQYAERNAVFLPVLFRSDLGVTQEIFQNVGGKRNTLAIRFDILNLDNLINKKWGAGDRLVSSTPLIPQGADANGALQYRLRNFGTNLLNTTYQHTAGISDVWRMQLGVRYTFN
ncbi:carboxypeptidase regulatory-like domain-containing protein [Gemmatimonas sp.]|uniref:TonB-dependent receptor n=1 Tax=Gemmatimonas sp. TaxID=1962908 RepID=UPI00286B9943|nr:carboxypeptidase regulatory-like domain-containing protein [Gemmatimonas sp.]